MKAVIVALLLLAPTSILAHSQEPGLETQYAFDATVYKTYKLTNDYDFPAVFTVDVFTKDMKPAQDWKGKKLEFKLMPGSTSDIKLKFKVDGTRKLLICSTLKQIGKNHEAQNATIISRICSRLVIHDSRSLE